MRDARRLAQRARREALVTALRGYPAMPLDQLIRLVSEGKYSKELEQIRLEDLRRGSSSTPLLWIRQGEEPQHAVIRVFCALADQWLSSGFFVRYLGLERWTAQKICGELAELGLVERRGVTSGTRYRWLEPEPELEPTP